MTQFGLHEDPPVPIHSGVCARLMVSVSRCLDMPFCKGTYLHIKFYSKFSFLYFFKFSHLYDFKMLCCVIYLPNEFVSLHPNSKFCHLYP
jgi:hypothetical protein